MRALQLCELEILDEFVRICEKYHLQYYLVGGTLLGAVRHKGFIPWDDDVDVAMPRKDYEKFARVCETELSADFFYQCPDTDPYYFLTYAKLRKKGTSVYEERFKKSKFYNGVFIDIIPLDLCPLPGPICHLLFNILAVMNYRGQVDSGEPYLPYQELIGKIGYSLLRLLGKRQIVAFRRGLIYISTILSDKRHLASYSGAYGYYREVFPACWFGKGSLVEFEGKKYNAPTEVELELTQIYGRDFMTLPPDDKRNGHIDLEKCVL